MAIRKGWGIEALNLQDALKAFDRVGEAFGSAPLKECLMPLARRTRDDAKRRVNTSTKAKSPGYLHLQDAIFASEGKENLPSVVVGVDRKKAPHAHLVEFGHGGKHPAPAHPFLRPAFDAIKRAGRAIVGAEVKQRIINKLARQYRKESEAQARAARSTWRTG